MGCQKAIASFRTCKINIHLIHNIDDGFQRCVNFFLLRFFKRLDGAFTQGKF